VRVRIDTANLFFVCGLLPGGICESNVFILQQTEFFYDLLFVRSVLFCFLYFSRDFITTYSLLLQFHEENTSTVLFCGLCLGLPGRHIEKTGGTFRIILTEKPENSKPNPSLMITLLLTLTLYP